MNNGRRQQLNIGEHTSGEDRISVVLSDASNMSCELMASALKRVRSFKILKYVVSTSEILDAVSTLNPDVTLVSINLSDGPYTGFKALRQLRSINTRTRYVMLMDDDERELVIEAFRAGVRGIFQRSASLQLLCRCISVVHHGQVWANNTELQQLLEALQTSMPVRCVNSRGETLLSKRERQIVPLVAEGFTNKEISQMLNLSEHTVKNHLFRIYDKLGVSSRVELILRAVTQPDEAA